MRSLKPQGLKVGRKRKNKEASDKEKTVKRSPDIIHPAWREFCKWEWGRLILKAFGVWLITTWLFYRSMIALIFTLPVFVLRLYLGAVELEREKLMDLQMQFKDAIQSISASLNIGYSLENAVVEAKKELLLIYPEDARISREMQIMVRQLRLQMAVEPVFTEFAQRLNLSDARSFVEVFIVAKKTGGNMVKIIQNTVKQIGDEIDVRREIDTILAAKKYEFRVMAVIPYGIIAYMQLSFPEFMDSLYGNAIGVGVMSVCLAGYMGAYCLGLRIIKIDV